MILHLQHTLHLWNSAGSFHCCREDASACPLNNSKLIPTAKLIHSLKRDRKWANNQVRARKSSPITWHRITAGVICWDHVGQETWNIEAEVCLVYFLCSTTSRWDWSRTGKRRKYGETTVRHVTRTFRELRGKNHFLNCTWESRCRRRSRLGSKGPCYNGGPNK